MQVRRRLVDGWESLVEYRWLKVRAGGNRKGFLVGADRQLARNFRVGIGYNFTDFSDDMTHLRYDSKGWFLNIAGYY